MENPSRDPGKEIKEILRKEVNYGCPVRYQDGSGCGCPILAYHHFDPVWAGNFKHNIDGMIALCPQHHSQADGKLWTNEQLREFKKNPYVDDVVRVRWPWNPETLVMKVGPSLVLGSGSPIRLDGLPVMRFHPHVIEGLPGIKTTIFDSDIRDAAQQKWLKISDGWFDLSLDYTADLVFTPQTKTFVAKHKDGTYIALQFEKYPVKDFIEWARAFLTKKEMADGLQGSIERVGAIDTDGFVPVVLFEGRFKTDKVSLDIKGNKMHFELTLPGHHEAIDFHSWIVDEKRNLRITQGAGKPDFFALG